MLNKIPQSVITAISLLNEHGNEARLAGGSVRDLLNNEKPKDFDIATTATPEQVIEVFSCHHQLIMTGLQHGTVTVVIDEEPLEITTLRIDKETDGRHAIVEFTDDWVADASRRDFTINAMFLDLDGKVHDFFNGRDDLKNGIVKFVGDPETRMHEDYLRILRYFRFVGRFNPKFVDNSTLQVIEDLSHNLTSISVERIWSEMQKILVDSKFITPVLKLMQRTKTLESIGLTNFDIFGPERISRLTDNPITILTAGLDSIQHVINNWKLSNVEQKFMKFLWEHKDEKLDLHKVTNLSLTHDKKWLIELVKLNCQSELIGEITLLEVPVFPVTGNDLLNRGFVTGKELGATLNSLRQQWIDSNFIITKDELLKNV